MTESLEITVHKTTVRVQFAVIANGKHRITIFETGMLMFRVLESEFVILNSKRVCGSVFYSADVSVRSTRKSFILTTYKDIYWMKVPQIMLNLI